MENTVTLSISRRSDCKQQLKESLAQPFSFCLSLQKVEISWKVSKLKAALWKLKQNWSPNQTTTDRVNSELADTGILFKVAVTGGYWISIIGGLSASLTCSNLFSFQILLVSTKTQLPFFATYFFFFATWLWTKSCVWPDGTLRVRYLSVKNSDPIWVLLQSWWSQTAGPLYTRNSWQDSSLKSTGKGHWWPGID